MLKAATVHFGLAACKSVSDLCSRIEGFIIIICKLAGSPHKALPLFIQTVPGLFAQVGQKTPAKLSHWWYGPQENGKHLRRHK